MKHKLNKRINKKICRLIRKLKNDTRYESMKDVAARLRLLAMEFEFNYPIITAVQKAPISTEPVFLNITPPAPKIMDTLIWHIAKNRTGHKGSYLLSNICELSLSDVYTPKTIMWLEKNKDTFELPKS
jgi:hypothetical protein